MYKIGNIIEVKVTGIEPYGIFVSAENNYSGLIHISEVDNNFVRDIHKYVSIGDTIYTNIVSIDKENKHLCLSIKNMNYSNNNGNTKKIKESISGFLPLYNKLPQWLNDKLEEIKIKKGS